MKPAIYTSGSMEFNKKCFVWRKKMNRALHHWYKIIIPDAIDCPFEKEDKEYSSWIKDFYIMPDMQSVATSRHFFVLLDQAVFKGAGTISELSLACWLGKEIVAVFDGITPKKIPSWIVGCLTGATVFKSVDEAISYYKEKAKNHENGN